MCSSFLTAFRLINSLLKGQYPFQSNLRFKSFLAQCSNLQNKYCVDLLHNLSLSFIMINHTTLDMK